MPRQVKIGGNGEPLFHGRMVLKVVKRYVREYLEKSVWPGPRENPWGQGIMESVGTSPGTGFVFVAVLSFFYEDIGYRKIDEPCEACLLVAAVPSCNLRDGDCVMRWGLV